MLHDFEDLKFRLAMGLPGCPWPEKRMACMEAYRELCERGQVLRSRVSVTVKAGTDQAYTLNNLKPGTSIEGAVFVATEAERELPRIVWDVRQTAGGLVQLVLGAAPVQVGDSLTVCLAHVPRLEREDDAPDREVLNDYSGAIVTGARSILHLMAGESWANPNLGVFERREFLRACGQARSRVDTGLTMQSRGLHA